jgi:hypothetical protein
VKVLAWLSFSPAGTYSRLAARQRAGSMAGKKASPSGLASTWVM